MDIVAAWVQFEIPFLLQAEDSIDNPTKAFQIQKDGIPAELRLSKQKQESSAHGGSMFGLVEGERLGNVSSTTVLIGFAEPFLESLDDAYHVEYEEVSEEGNTLMTSTLDTPQGKIAEGAVAWLNEFLETYRATFGYYWIRRLQPSEIAHFQLTFVAENGDEYTEGLMYAKDGLTLGTTTMDEEQRTILQSRLKSDESVPTPVALELDAKNNLDLGEYRLAVIVSATMFESLLKTSLREVMQAEGKSKEEIKKAFQRDDGGYKGVKQLAKECHKTFHFDFKGSDEFDAWNKKTRELRNSVIHEGYEPSEEEAVGALAAAEDARNLLTKKITERIEKLHD